MCFSLRHPGEHGGYGLSYWDSALICLQGVAPCFLSLHPVLAEISELLPPGPRCWVTIAGRRRYPLCLACLRHSCGEREECQKPQKQLFEEYMLRNFSLCISLMTAMFSVPGPFRARSESWVSLGLSPSWHIQLHFPRFADYSALTYKKSVSFSGLFLGLLAIGLLCL